MSFHWRFPYDHCLSAWRVPATRLLGGTVWSYQYLATIEIIPEQDKLRRLARLLTPISRPSLLCNHSELLIIRLSSFG